MRPGGTGAFIQGRASAAAMASGTELFTWFIRFLHIFSGVMWVGGAFLWGMLIAPNVLQRGPPPIRRPFLEAVLAKVTRYFIISGSLTILTGFWTLGLIVGWSQVGSTFSQGSYGIGLGVGVVAAIVMFVLGWFVIKPTGEKLLKVMQSMPAPAPGSPPPAPPAELAALGKKIGIASMTNLLLGTIALGAMAWAVNVVR